MTRRLTAATTVLAFLLAVGWTDRARAQMAPTGSAPASGPSAMTAPAAPAAPAPPSDDAIMQQARAHFESGRAAYNASDFVGAIREFKAAEQLRPSPILAYNIGLANEKLQKRRVAVKYYRRYLELQPNASNRAEVEQRIAGLEQEIAAQPPPAVNAVPGGTAPQPPAPSTPSMVEQPSDMPPPAPAQPTYYGSDPYAYPAAPYRPYQPPAKKKSRWWIGLVVAGGIVVIVVPVIVVAVVLSDAAKSNTNHWSTQLPQPTGPAAPAPANFTLFRF